MSELYLAYNNNNPKYLVIAPNNFDNDIRICNIVHYYTIIEIPNIRRNRPNYYYFISFKFITVVYVIYINNNKINHFKSS